MDKKMIFNKNGQRGTESMFKGNSTNLREWDNIKYSWAYDMYRVMLNNFWIPEEISLVDDSKQFESLTDNEKFAFNRIISFLNFLDSIQSENIPNLTRYIKAPEITSILNIQTFQEEVHAQSYAYVLNSVTDPVNRDNIYNLWKDDELLFQRIDFITSYYQNFNENPTRKNFVLMCMANYVLEGIYFYSGFMFFYNLARNGKMSGTASIFKYINRDETTHLVIFQNIIKEILSNPDDFLDKEEIEEELKSLLIKGVEWEIKWGCYVVDNKIQGLPNNLISDYIKYLGNVRSKSIGLGVIYPENKENPAEWVNRFSDINNNKTDFFEAKVINYNKNAKYNMDSLNL